MRAAVLVLGEVGVILLLNGVLEMFEKLQALFPVSEIKWKPQALTQDKKRAMVVAYLDARAIMRRLDDVCGPFGWACQMRPAPNNQMSCAIGIKHSVVYPGQDVPAVDWVWKEDVGGESEQEKVGDRTKAAASDAFKRAASMWGIGRYFWNMPRQWVDYDPVKKVLLQTPQVPDWAVPGGEGQGPTVPMSAVSDKPKRSLTGAELERKLVEYDRMLSDAHLIKQGELISHMREQGRVAGAGENFELWNGGEINAAVAEAKDFEKRKKAEKAAKDKEAAEAVSQENIPF